MERGHRAPVATFVVPELPAGGGSIALDDAAAHHARVRRLTVGDAIRLTTGTGILAEGTIQQLGQSELVAEAGAARRSPQPPLLEVMAPVADRDRMLWLAEKCAEFAVSVWQPVLFARSRSVTPRGVGEAFEAKVRARMAGALEQSGGAWLPEIRPPIPLAAAARAARAPVRYVLARGGAPLDPSAASKGAAVIFGPEGGIEPSESDLLDELGWRRVGLAPATLRFETAGIAAVSILRAAVTAGSPED